MNKLEILQLEDPDNIVIKLHKEGMFWRAYELSAYRFVYGIMPCKVNAHYYRNIDHNVVNIGVPEKTLTRNKAKFEVISREPRLWVIKPLKFLPIESFKDWKTAIENAMPKDQEIKETEQMILEKIREFRISYKTPMECMQFLITIQKKLNGGLRSIARI